MPLNLFSKDLGVDLGTTNTLIFCKGKGVVLKEASVVAMRKIGNNDYEVIAIGEEARKMLGRTSENISVIRPIKDGTIANIEAAEIMLKAFLKKVLKNNFKVGFSPRVVISIPFGVSSIERNGVVRAAKAAGVREVILIEEPLAAAIGAGLVSKDPIGNMIVDIGGGKTEAAVVSLGEIVCCKSINIGGDAINDTIIRHIRKVYNIAIGEAAAEEIKIKLCAAISRDSNSYINIQGLDLLTGLPKMMSIPIGELFSTLKEPFELIIQVIKDTLLKSPPDLVSDIIDNGIYLTGGTALLSGLDKIIADETNISIHITENPLECVVNGIASEMEHINKIKKIYDNDFM